MRKVIGIYYNATFEESSFETGCGGSDTWVIQIAKQFVREGFHTIVFCDSESWKLTSNGVEYVPLNLFEYRCEYQHFDYFIITRMFNEHLYYKLVECGCKNIYIQSHDPFIWDKNLYVDKYIYQPNKYPFLKKYIALTDFHKWELHEYNKIPYDMIEVIGNGIDSDVFDFVDKEPMEKDNNILFTSVYSRGGDILVNHVLPLVKKEIPECRVHLCGYVQNFPEDVRNNPDVDILGMLSKEDYYREFRKHKVWFLPCTVPEDFGLCACEAAMSLCDIVSTFEHGMGDVCYPFVNLAMDNRFKTIQNGEYHRSQYQLDMSKEDFDRVCQDAAERIIYSMKHYYEPAGIVLRQSFKNFILGTHNWKNVVEKWKNLFAKSGQS